MGKPSTFCEVESKIRRVKIEECKSILEEQNGNCIYCGKPIDINLKRGEHWSLEHIVPIAILKWLYNNNNHNKLDMNNLVNILSSNKNLAIAHHKCNMYKSNYILKEQDIYDLHTSEERKEKHCSILLSSGKYIKAYNDIVNRLYQKQKQCCGMCNKHKPLRLLEMRRKSWDFDRFESNAVLLCKHCVKKRDKEGISL